MQTTLCANYLLQGMAESLHYIQGVGLVEELMAELLMVGVEVDMVQNQLILGLSGSGPLLRIHSCAL